MLYHIKSLSRLARMALVCGFVLAVSAAGRQSHAQPLRTLQVQDGEVYIDGEQVPVDQLPASLNLAGVEMRFQFMGDVDPVIALGERLYRVEGERLVEVGWAGQAVMPFAISLDAPASPAPLFPEAFTTPFATASLAIESAPGENAATVVGQEVLQAQAFALEQLVEEIERQNRLKGDLNRQGTARSAQIGQVPLLRHPLQGINAQEAALMTEKLRYQAERMAVVARQLPQIEIRNYLNDVQQHDAELYERLVREQRLELESLQLAAHIRELQLGGERAAREDALRALRSKLEEIFELKQDNRRREISQLRDQLGELQHHLDERERLHRRIIENRMQELTGEPVSQE